MKNLNIYIMTGNKSPAERTDPAIYLLEYIRENGEPVTRSEISMITGASNTAAVETLLKAIRRIKEPCSLSIYTENGYLVSGINWMQKWEEAGWKNGKGEHIKNCEQWQEILHRTINMTIAVHLNEQHTYMDWMAAEIRRCNGREENGRNHNRNGGTHM